MMLDGERDHVSRLFFDFIIGAHNRSDPCSLVSLIPPRVSSALPMWRGVKYKLNSAKDTFVGKSCKEFLQCLPGRLLCRKAV